MKTRLLLFAALLLTLALTGQAQTPPQLTWTHDGVNVTHFECWIDGAYGGSLGLPTPSGQTYTAALSLCGTLAGGQHSLVINACNYTLCTAAGAITVVKL